MSNPGPCACTTLRRATRAITSLYDAALSSTGLRVTQFSVLRVLDRNGPLTITALAAAAALDRSTMGRNLHPLQRRRLVNIAGSKDQRERLVRVTRAGRAAIKRALPRWDAVQSRVESVTDVRSIHRLVERIEGLKKT
ncbi:MAG TPA: MarR family transcriptional regulator [Xanthobacteraceae bacterium]|nr:MarR family transcriptional regulator [Xanthobacteraceae bacterium]